MLHKVCLALGSNIGDKDEHLNQALKQIGERVGKVITHSSFYSTLPVGFQSENTFLNAACLVETSLKPFQLLDETQAIEKDLGRVSKSYNKMYSDRIIDIDIILYDDLVLLSEDLVLPHPHFHERLFVLEPMAEIIADYTHPIIGKSILELIKDCQSY